MTSRTVRHTAALNGALQKGFTIVELLVVIVVIAILATIVGFSFNAARSTAIDSALRSDIDTAKAQLKSDHDKNFEYPASLALANGGRGITPSDNIELRYFPFGGKYCLVATSTVADMEVSYDTDSDATKEGNCDSFIFANQTTVASAPAISTTSLPGATKNTAYSARIVKTGSPSPALSVTSGALPAGLSLNPSTGQISGIPTTAGVYTFTVRAQNSGGQVSRSLSITVTGVMTELLVNGGFEDGVTGWELQYSVGSFTEIVHSGAPEGSKYLRTGDDYAYTFAASPGEVLHVSGWGRFFGGGIDDADIRLVAYNASDVAVAPTLGIYDYDIWAATSSWAQFSGTATVPAGATKVKVELWPGFGAQSGWDGISVRALR